MCGGERCGLWRRSLLQARRAGGVVIRRPAPSPACCWGRGARRPSGEIDDRLGVGGRSTRLISLSRICNTVVASAVAGQHPPGSIEKPSRRLLPWRWRPQSTRPATMRAFVVDARLQRAASGWSAAHLAQLRRARIVAQRCLLRRLSQHDHRRRRPARRGAHAVDSSCHRAGLEDCRVASARRMREWLRNAPPWRRVGVGVIDFGNRADG